MAGRSIDYVGSDFPAKLPGQGKGAQIACRISWAECRQRGKDGTKHLVKGTKRLRLPLKQD